MLLLILIALIPLLVIVYEYIKYGKIREQIKHTSGPPMLPLVGNAHQLRKDAPGILHWIFDEWHKCGQSNFRFWIGYYLHIMVAEVKDVEFILSSTMLIEKSDIYDMLHQWLGEGLLTSKGIKWHKHRKMITPSFHFKILQDFHEVMNNRSTQFMAKLREVSKGDSIFDFQNMVHYLTLDVICDTAMGVHINAMDNNESEFAKAVQYICYNIHLRITHPLKRKVGTYQFFPDYKDYCKALKVLQDFTNEVIDKRMKALENPQFDKANHLPEDEFKKHKTAFLDTLLSSTIDGRPLTRQELYEEVSTFIFEGHDTTTSAITFTIFMLSRHLAVQKKVLEEQQRVMENNLKGDASFQQLAEMKYLDLVIKETLRLYPSVPLIGRLTDKEYNMNGKIIPADTSLLVFVMGLGYDEKIYSEPYRFDPERFTDNSANRNPYEYVPFSAGLRNCVGQKFAMLELKTIISKIVRNFEILPALDELESKDGYVSNFFGPYRYEKASHKKYDPILSAVLTLKSDNGVFLRLRERK